MIYSYQTHFTKYIVQMLKKYIFINELTAITFGIVFIIRIKFRFVKPIKYLFILRLTE